MGTPKSTPCAMRASLKISETIPLSPQAHFLLIPKKQRMYFNFRPLEFNSFLTFLNELCWEGRVCKKCKASSSLRKKGGGRSVLTDTILK